MSSKLFSIFFVILFVAKTTAQNPSALYQNWVDAQVNNTTPTLPTFSYAGYHNGEISLPSSFSQQVYNVTDYGAVANDNKSDKQAIIATIAAAEANPNGGIVFFPPGRFIVHDTNPTESGVVADVSDEIIRISKSNIVLKGSGRGVNGTELYQKSHTTHPDMATKDYVCPYLFLFWNGEDSANTFITNVTGNSDRESHTVQVASTANITVGQWVELYVKNTATAFVNEELAPFSTSDFYQPANLKIVNDGVEVREFHKVVSKTANSITFKEPIHRAVNATYGWKINNFKALEEVGIQDLKYTGGFIWNHLHHQAPQELFPGEPKSGPNAFLSSSGWSGIQFNHVVNSWITNIEFSAVSQAAQIKFSAYSTALDVRYSGNPGHNFISTNSATGCFIGKNKDVTTGVWHGCGVNGKSIGNVFWRNSSPKNGNSGIEMHASQPRSTLIDACSGGMFFNQGGSTGALPNHLKNMVLWNFDGVSYQNNNVKTFRPNNETIYAKFITPIISGLKGFTMSSATHQTQVNESSGTHVDETSLYESQLAYRLGFLPNWVSGTPDEVVSKKVIYFEDFGSDSNRGFFKKLKINGGQTPENIFKRVSNLPDLADSYNLFDENVDRETSRIPNGAALGNPTSQRTLSVSGTNVGSSTNFGIEAYAIFTPLNLSSTNPNIDVTHTYKYASFWSQRRFGQGDIATISLQVSTDYNPPAVNFENATWVTVPLHSGKFGNTTNNEQKFVKGMVDLTSFANGVNGDNVTLALKYQGSSSAYSSSNRNGTFYFSDLQFIVQTAPITNTWDGSSNSDVTEPANWDTKAAPVSNTNNLLIPAGLTNYPTVTNPLTVNEITIASGASFISTSTVTGNVTYKRNLSFIDGNTQGWHLVGSPVVGQVYNDAFLVANAIASGTNNNRGIATYNNTVASNNWTYHQFGATETFDVGKGYSIKTYEDKDVSFTGTMNTNPVNVAISKSTKSFNLISNPYTSYINSGAFLNLQTNADKLTSKTIWVWNPISKNHETKIAGEAFKIAPAQGFYVSCKTAGNLTFQETIQSHQNTDTFLKSEQKPEIQINITEGNLNRFAKIYYINSATKDFDNGFDGETFDNQKNTLDVFTHLVENNLGKNYQIQSLPNQDLETMIIPVGLKSEAGKEIIFSADVLNLPNNIKVFLEERQNNTFTRLDENNSSYKVILSKDINDVGRFYLHTKSEVLNSSQFELENVSIFMQKNSNLRITGLKKVVTNFEMYTLLSKKIKQSSFYTNGVKDISLSNLKSGIYIVQLTTVKGKLNRKLIIE